jgi:hypothetical protein
MRHFHPEAYVRFGMCGALEKNMSDISAVKDLATPGLMAIPGVVGVGVTEDDDGPAILILVKELTSELKLRLPSTLVGYRVIVEAVGEIRGSTTDY